MRVQFYKRTILLFLLDLPLVRKLTSTINNSVRPIVKIGFEPFDDLMTFVGVTYG